MILVISILLTSGCSYTENIKPEYVLNKNTREGIILASMTTSNQHPSKAFSWNIYIDDLSEKSVAHLSSLASYIYEPWSTKGTKDVRGRYYIFALPEGKYKIDSWMASGQQMGHVELYPKEKPKKIEFTVNAGEITYLGRFHMEFLVGDNIFGIPIVYGGYPEISNWFHNDYQYFIHNYPRFRDMPYHIDIPVSGLWSSQSKKSIEPLPPTNFPSRDR
ncbi:hypothetical protein [Thiolapillus brandeum]|uniref:hypothetical protein n=1 Tax=Thiolapillus brandeum TaxID=1076588 RepID=UPI00155A6983|nr:hypothetical protein [Thiolapillus brandeum]